MPSHIIHLLTDWFFLGKFYPEIHKYMDSAQPVLQSKHRVFYHDQDTVNQIWEETQDAKAAWSAYLHIILDEVSDKVGQEMALPALIEMVKNGEIVL